MNNQMLSSQINLARSIKSVTATNLQAGEILSMQDAVKRTCSLYWKRHGVKPTTLSIPVGWWEILHEFFTEDLELSYSNKYIPASFGSNFGTHFNVGMMEPSVDPIQLKGKRHMPKKHEKELDIESALSELNLPIEDDDELFDVAAAIDELMRSDQPSTEDEDIEFVVEFDAYHEVESKWITYEFAAHSNGSLVTDDEEELLMVWIYGKVNKKGRMKKPRLAVIWSDQPGGVYTWPIYPETLYNIIVENMSLARYVADNLAVGEDMEHEFFTYEEFANMMTNKFGVDILTWSP